MSAIPEIAMAAYKQEVVINQERHEISAIFQRILDIFDQVQHVGDIDNIVRCRPTSSRQPEIAMAACKPEVVITQERNEIAAKSQRLPNIFDYDRLTGTGPDIVRCRPTNGNSNGGQKPVCSPPLLFLVVGRMSVEIAPACWAWSKMCSNR